MLESTAELNSLTTSETKGNLPTKQAIVFSGMQPTGNIHLGNYLGAIRNWVDMQDQFDNIFCVVDYHAITMPHNPAELRVNTFELAKTFLAAGLEPSRCTLFIQSHVPAHTELGWILNNVAHYGELKRMTQFKDKAGKNAENVRTGLFTYPVLMAADILLYDTAFVPVGEDQKQHVELTRDVAIRFNNTYGETFVIPEPLIKEAGARIMGLDNPLNKMSKSAPTVNNYIALRDDPDTIRRKLSRAVTDSDNEVRPGPAKPALTNLLMIYSLLSRRPMSEIVTQYEGKGYREFKQELAEIIVESLAPIQARLDDLSADPAEVYRILQQGALKARERAEVKMKLVREQIGLMV